MYVKLYILYNRIQFIIRIFLKNEEFLCFYIYYIFVEYILENLNLNVYLIVFSIR